jgi:hypothetical protein
VIAEDTPTSRGIGGGSGISVPLRAYFKSFLSLPRLLCSIEGVKLVTGTFSR